MAFEVLGSTLSGIDAKIVRVQIDSAPGLHAFSVVGLGDKAVQESVDRINAAVRQAGLIPPRSKNRRFVINLAPADVRKEGSGFDFPIALAYLAHTGQVPPLPSDTVVIGELGLDGALSHTNGILSSVMAAREAGARQVWVPVCNASEASAVDGIEALGFTGLRQAVSHLRKELCISPMPLGTLSVSSDTKVVPSGTSSVVSPYRDLLSPHGANLGVMDAFGDIHGQLSAKRALTIAAAGSHNVLMFGSPGSGKTILARALPQILPPLTRQESLEVARVHSAAGMLRGPISSLQRPFYAPHHTASTAAIVGGGSSIRPGLISLAHRGVLFMDELPEFARDVLESLRQPLEDGIITVSRSAGSVVLPAKFMFVAAMNPCPCGNLGDAKAVCVCSAAQTIRYAKRISGPLLDRMDIQVNVPRESIPTQRRPDTPTDVQGAVLAARSRQATRFDGSGIITNSELTHKNVESLCSLTASAASLLRTAVNRQHHSMRVYHKAMKVARTIADLDDQPHVLDRHVAEALSLRVAVPCIAS